jgi:hypothetical protein
VNFINAEMVLYVLMRCLIPTAVFGYHGIGKSSLPWQLLRRRRKELGQPYETITMTSKGAMGFQNKNGLMGCFQADIPVMEKDEIIGFGETINLKAMAWDYALRLGDGQVRQRARTMLEELRKDWWKDYPETEGRDIFVIYCRNHRFIPPPNHEGGCIWAIEELNRDQSGLRGPICQIGLAGGFLDYTLPKDTWMYASMNPPDGDYEVTPLDAAMMNRFALIKVRSDIDSWVEWAVKSGVGWDVIESVITNEAQVFNPHEKNFELPRRDCASRNIGDLTKVVRFMGSDEGLKLNMPPDLVLETISSIVGETAGVLINNDLNNPNRERAIPGKDILDGYGWEPRRGGWDDYYDGIDHSNDKEPGKDNSSLVMSSTRARVRAISGVNDNDKKLNLGMLGLTNQSLTLWLTELNDKIGKSGRPSDGDFKRWMNFCLYANDLPDDFRAGLLVNHTMTTTVRKTIEKLSEMAYDREEDMNDALMHRGHMELGSKLKEEEAKLAEDKAAA